MLVLTLKKGEWLHVGTDIFIQISDVRGKFVRLAIQADGQLVQRKSLTTKLKEAEDDRTES
jgi:sRNA-binding carbon storage regulator CsrA